MWFWLSGRGLLRSESDFVSFPLLELCAASFVPNTCLKSLSNVKSEGYGKEELASCRKRSGKEVSTRQRCSQLCVAISRRAVAEDPTSHPPARPYRHPYLLTSVGVSGHLFRLILHFESQQEFTRLSTRLTGTSGGYSVLALARKREFSAMHRMIGCAPNRRFQGGPSRIPYVI